MAMSLEPTSKPYAKDENPTIEIVPGTIYLCPLIGSFASRALAKSLNESCLPVRRTQTGEMHPAFLTVPQYDSKFY
jgi:hypothetical protein